MVKTVVGDQRSGVGKRRPAVGGQPTAVGWKWIRSIYRATLHVRQRLWLRDDHQPRVEYVDGIPIIVLPGVFNGVRLRTGAFLAQTLDATRVPAGAHVLDLGAGSGIGAIWAARWAAHVVATDINPEAVRCVRINALAQHCDHKIETRLGDLFEPVRSERFDVILFNPPFYRGQPRDMADCAWRSPDVFDRFLHDLPCHLRKDGRALVILSSEGEIADALWSANHLSVRPVRRRDLINEILTVYEVQVCST
jgi:release factor glutamine methyltransferase